MKYRAEIDGLRALAVIPVILFHAGFELFSGGFVGVDVFFVISGYLITTIIINDIENNRFSIIDFYVRRAKRILPALFFVMLCCIPFAWMWMQPRQFENFSQSLFAVVLFASNILFWLEIDYFDPSAEEKPLLHTWSLAVEEQYYLFFPVFLILCWRFGKRPVFWMLCGIALISFCMSEWGWRNNPPANFYLAPTRAWELFLGSIAAFIVNRRGVQSNNVLSGLGLLAIVASIFVYNERTPFPSVYTLLPTLGVVLIVLYAERETIVAKILSTSALVGIGLISYSAYLWHQPLFAFARIRDFENPSALVFISLSFLSLGLAYFSWRFVEQPFRTNKISRGRKIFVPAAVFTLFFIALGSVGFLNKGFPIPSNDNIQAYVKSGSDEANIEKDIWILGDSHGEHLISGLSHYSSGEIQDLTSPGCIPLRDVDRYDFRFVRGECVQRVNHYLDEVIASDPEIVFILANMGPVYFEGTVYNGKHKERVIGLEIELISNPDVTDPWEILERGLRNTFSELSKLNNVQTVFAIDIPELGLDSGCLNKRKQLNTPFFTMGDFVAELPSEECSVIRSVYDKRVEKYNRTVKAVASEFPKIRVFDPTPYFCNTQICQGVIENYGYVYRDADHLSEVGSVYWAEHFSRWLLQFDQ